MPLRLEIETPIPQDWVLTIHQEMLISGQDVHGGWKMVLDGTVAFSLDPTNPQRRFSGSGHRRVEREIRRRVQGRHAVRSAARITPPRGEMEGSILDLGTLRSSFKVEMRGKSGDSIGATMKCKALGGITVDAARELRDAAR